MSKKNFNRFRAVSRNGYEHIVEVNKNNKMICDCLDDIYHGIPCRHQIAIVVKKKGVPNYLLPFLNRWRKDYYKEPQGCLINLGKVRKTYVTFN